MPLFLLLTFIFYYDEKYVIITNKRDDYMEKYIVWDWNGTLFNDVDLCVESINYLLNTQGLSPLANKEAYQMVFRFPIIEYYKAVGFDFKRCSFEELAILYMDYYQSRSLSCQLYEEAYSALAHYHNKGYRQILLSASKNAYLMKQLDQFNISHYFYDILSLDNIHAHSKKELACTYFKEQGILPHQSVFIGDSVHDYEVAQAVSASCILIANGHEHKSRLDKTNATVIDRIESLSQIII